jgi:hypothetical protein
MRKIIIEIDEHDFEFAFGRKPTKEEFEKFVNCCEKGIHSQLDWNIILSETKEIMKK